MAHVSGLWAIAVAHPLLDVLGRAPEFFVAHRAGAPDILLLLGGLVLAVPLVFAAAIGIAAKVGPRMASAVTRTLVAVLACLLTVQLLKHLGLSTAPAAAAISAVCGLAVAALYARLAALRTFFTVLSTAVAIVPLVFLARPGIARLVVPQVAGSGALDPGRQGYLAAPVVLVVLDELPLLSLLDADRNIDPVLYPNFSALARDGVWFRNATTVNDYTRWALPAILTGRLPEPDDVPTPGDHPDTLFSYFGRTHRLEVVESVTDLCPRRLCADAAETLSSRLESIGADVSILAAYVFLTPDLHVALGLPELTGNWAGFTPGTADVDASPNAWKKRWHQARRHDKRDVVTRFIEGIRADDPQPTFYFLHTLLSHHPWNYLPGGQRVSRPAPLAPAMRAVLEDDDWAIVQNQQRHLLQMGFIDRVLGRLVARLKDASLYDGAVVVITADHGAAFTRGRHMRNFTPETASEIMRVPLIVKFPARVHVANHFPEVNRAGQRVSDRNVEVVDIAPTIAHALGAPLPWRTDGSSLLDPSPRRPEKRIWFGAGKKQQSYGPEGPPLDPALARRLANFDGASNPFRVPRPPRYGEIVGRAVGDFRVLEGRVHATVRSAWEYAEFDPAAEAVPFEVSGELQGRPGPDMAYVAVAVNGVIRAVTRTWQSKPAAWLATPPLDAWRPGENSLEVFIVQDGGGQPVLTRAWKSIERPEDLNLISGAAEHYWNVRQRGFYAHEGRGDRVFRWTRGDAAVTVGLRGLRPVGVRLHIIRGAHKGTKLKLAANGCTLYEGPVPRQEWEETFPLAACRITGNEISITLASDTARAPRGGDRRRLGVAVRSLTVLTTREGR